jgi:hypothetical protein
VSEFQAGERVELVSTTDEITGVQPGDRGTVMLSLAFFSRPTTIVAWDNGSTLAMVEGLDVIKRIEDE